jgi:hypothetical protein
LIYEAGITQKRCDISNIGRRKNAESSGGIYSQSPWSELNVNETSFDLYNPTHPSLENLKYYFTTVYPLDHLKNFLDFLCQLPYHECVGKGIASIFTPHTFLTAAQT